MAAVDDYDHQNPPLSSPPQPETVYAEKAALQ